MGEIIVLIMLLLFAFLDIAIFILLPYFIAELISGNIESSVVLTLIEGVIRISIFILYIFLISKMKDIKRLFMYHGAEHKVINCIENGHKLTVENVRGQSREHRRCGTSFTFLVMFVSMLLQRFTTGEPDDEMIEVAIESVNAVFDWKAFLEEAKNEQKDPAIEFVDNLKELSDTQDITNTYDESSSTDDLETKKITDIFDEDDEILQAVELILKEK